MRIQTTKPFDGDYDNLPKGECRLVPLLEIDECNYRNLRVTKGTKV